MEEAKTVSFVVPTRNSDQTLANCLTSIRKQSHEAVEIVVIDNSSSDDTMSIAEELSDLVIVGGPERSAQRNLGLRASTGDYIVFIDSDMILSPGIATEVVEAFQADQAVEAIVIPEVVVGQGFWERCRALEKEAYLGDESVEAARAFRKQTLITVGGYDESLTAAEDWELTDRVRATGGQLSRIESKVVHDESSITLKGAFRKKKYYGASFRRFLSQHKHKSRGRFARRSLLRPLRSIAKDPFHVGGLYVLKTIELLGIVWGILAYRRKSSA